MRRVSVRTRLIEMVRCVKRDRLRERLSAGVWERQVKAAVGKNLTHSVEPPASRLLMPLCSAPPTKPTSSYSSRGSLLLYETSCPVGLSLHCESLAKTRGPFTANHLLKGAPLTLRGPGYCAPGFRGSSDNVWQQYERLAHHCPTSKIMSLPQVVSQPVSLLKFWSHALKILVLTEWEHLWGGRLCSVWHSIRDSSRRWLVVLTREWWILANGIRSQRTLLLLILLIFFFLQLGCLYCCQDM